MNAAIDCYNNGLPGPEDHFITLGESINVTGGFNDISGNSSNNAFLKIQGVRSNFLVGTGDTPGVNEKSMFTIVDVVNGVDLEGFSINNAYNNAISVIGGTRTVNLDNLLVLNSQQSALAVVGRDIDVNVSESTFLNSGSHGISADGEGGGSTDDGNYLGLFQTQVRGSVGHGINIENGAEVEVNDGSEITDNRLSGIAVGGPPVDMIENFGFLRTNYARIFDNDSDGVLVFSGVVVLEGALITDNQVGVAVNPGSLVTIDRSTIANNEGMGVAFSGRDLYIVNSTLSSNFEGLNYSGDGSVIVSSSTIVFNDGDGISANGDSPAFVASSVVALNGEVAFGGNCSDAPLVDPVTGVPKLIDLGGNFSSFDVPPENPDDSTTSCGFFSAQDVSLIGDLGDNGCSVVINDNVGCMPTHELLSGNPAIAQGDCRERVEDPNNTETTADVPEVTNEQRGPFRSTVPCSAGAYESPTLYSKVLRNNQWYQIGLPADPGSSRTLSALFGDELNINDLFHTWAIFEYVIDPVDPALDGYRRFTPSTELIPGKGYWILQDTGQSVNISLPPGSVFFSGMVPSPGCPSIAGCISVPVSGGPNVDRVNLVSYPLPYSSDFQDTLVAFPGACANGCSPSEASSANVLFDRAFRWNENQYDVITSAGLPIRPWDGLWMSTLNGTSGEVEWLLPLSPD